MEDHSQTLKYQVHVYFEQVHPTAIYTALSYFRSHKNFYENISISNNILNDEILGFSKLILQRSGTFDQE